MAKRVLIALAAFVMLNAATATIVGGSSKAAVSDPDVVHAANFVVSSANTNACSGLCAGLQKEGELKLVKVGARGAGRECVSRKDAANSGFVARALSSPTTGETSSAGGKVKLSLL